MVRPRVGLRAAVQPWAEGRNPVGIGKEDKAGTTLLRWLPLGLRR